MVIGYPYLISKFSMVIYIISLILEILQTLDIFSVLNYIFVHFSVFRENTVHDENENF